MELEDVLFKYFGYKTFREPQKEIIEQILSGRDTLTILPTGAGKSLIYQVPGLVMEGLVLVVSPLISLMKDQVYNLKKLKINASFISKDLSFNEVKDIYYNKDKYKFLYVSAERLENPLFLNAIKKVSLLVIDEAHTIKWGEDFRKSLFRITKFINQLETRPTVACFTATLNQRDQRLIIEKSGLINPYITNYLPIKDNLSFNVLYNKKPYHLEQLLKDNKKTIVYLLTRYKTEILYNFYKDKIECFYYHGGLDKEIKNQNYLGFKNSKSGVIFCTNSFGMGIDIRDIRRVILYDLPINLSDLIQQVGRAGRDNLACESYILFSKDSVETSLKFIYQSSNQKEKIKDLDQVVKFCYSEDKKKFIKDYFK